MTGFDRIVRKGRGRRKKERVLPDQMQERSMRGEERGNTAVTSSDTTIHHGIGPHPRPVDTLYPVCDTQSVSRVMGTNATQDCSMGTYRFSIDRSLTSLPSNDCDAHQRRS